MFGSAGFLKIGCAYVVRLMNPGHTALARKISIFLCATALAAGAITLAYQSGCAQNAAGDTNESLDFQLVSAWLMMPSLIMFSALFAVAKNRTMLQIIFRVAFFLTFAIPIAIAILLYIQNLGKAARWNPTSTICKRVASSPIHSVTVWPYILLNPARFARWTPNRYAIERRLA